MRLDWQRVWSVVVGNTIFHTLSLFFVVFCGYFGLSPEGWIKGLMPTSITDGSLLVARIIFLFLGCAVLVLLIHDLRDWGWPSPYIPMGKAAIRAYEEARTAERLVAYMAERVSRGKADEVTNYLATYIAQHIETFGRKPPSTQRETFLIGSGTFKAQGTEYWENHANAPAYVSVEVKRVDFKDFLRALRTQKDV